MNKNKLNTLRLPVIVAPMFLVSGPDLVVASSKAGLVGSFPGPNARTIEDLENWMHTITNSLDGELWAFNMIAHRTYDRFQDELDLIAKTVMRKKDFRTSNPVLRVENFKNFKEFNELLDTVDKLDKAKKPNNSK